jgi:hypothetical protein
MDSMMNEKKLTGSKPLMELVDLGTPYVTAASGLAPSKGCGCTPPTKTQAPTA